MKDMILRILLSLVKKEQIITFVAGAVFALAASLLHMTPEAFKNAVCASKPIPIQISK